MNLKSHIREFPGFPEPGILFKDISPILKNPKAMNYVLDQFHEHYKNERVDIIAGMELRGLIFAAALAAKFDKGLFMIRKQNKLPGPTIKKGYDIEYGNAIMEVQKDALEPGQHVLVVDDLLATGGTAHAAAELITKLGGHVTGFSFVIELLQLKGREKISNFNIQTLVNYNA